MTTSPETQKNLRKPEKIAPRFNPGDRVAERPKTSYISCIRKESREKIQQFQAQRYGTVVDTLVKITPRRGKNPLRQHVVRIQWDGQRNIAEHAQMRICLAEELPQILEEYSSIYNSLDI